MPSTDTDTIHVTRLLSLDATKKKVIRIHENYFLGYDTLTSQVGVKWGILYLNMSTYLFVHEYLCRANKHAGPSLCHKQSLPLKGEVIIDIAPTFAPRMGITLRTHLQRR